MVDRLTALLEKIPVSLIFLVLVGYYGYEIYDFKTSPTREVTDLGNQVTALIASNDKLQVRLRELEKFKLELDQKRQAIRGLTTRLDEVKANLPEDFNVPLFMQTVITEAKRAGLIPEAIRPVDKTAKGEFYEHSFDFTFRGVYHQLLMFLKRLTQLQTIIRIDNYSVRPTSRKVGNIPEIEGKIVVKGFSYLRTNADEISKKSGGG